MRLQSSHSVWAVAALMSAIMFNYEMEPMETSQKATYKIDKSR